MSESVRVINGFFKVAIKPEVDDLKNKLVLSDRQEQIFHMYYIRKNDLNYIADNLNCCPEAIGKELKTIRKKILKAMDL